MFLLKTRFRLFLEKPSLVRKLARLGKYFLGQPLGSQSNTNLDEYSYYRAYSSMSSSQSLASTTATTGGSTLLFFLKPLLGGACSASAAGLAMSLRRCPGRIIVCMVLDQSLSSSQFRYFGLPIRCCAGFSGCFSIFVTLSSSLLIISPLSFNSFCSSQQVFLSLLIMFTCYRSIFSFSSSCLCSRLTISFKSSNIFLFLLVTSFRSYSSLNRYWFSALSYSFFFFSKVCSISRASSSFIFWMGLMSDQVSLLAEKGLSLKAVDILWSDQILIIEEYSLGFFFLVSSRKISLYSWEVRQFLSISSNLSSMCCASFIFFSSANSLIIWFISLKGRPFPFSGFILL